MGDDNASMPALPRLVLSRCRRHLALDNGQPFFYLGDTAWELLHRLTLSEAEEYLQTRARQGFNVVQTVALAELDGLRVPAACGFLPLENGDPTRPVEGYWRHVDAVVKLANSYGVYIGLMPAWGDKWNQGPGAGPEIFTPATAYAYGEWLGQRYRDAGVVWILGGDRPVATSSHREILASLAAGLRAGDGGRALITFHPPGGRTSREFWPAEEWLDFDMAQSGHCLVSLENYKLLAACRDAQPLRPCLDGEPCYEDHEVMLPEWKPVKPGWRYDAHAVRRAAWWALLSGACGHVYGAQPCWMMWDERYEPFGGVRMTWREALKLPGAQSMRALHTVAGQVGFPFYPCPSFAEGERNGWEYTVIAARAARAPATLIYSPLPQNLILHLDSQPVCWSLAQMGLEDGQAIGQVLAGKFQGTIFIPSRLLFWNPDALIMICHEPRC